MTNYTATATVTTETATGYYGWRNWETWNVSLWIGNDEGLYQLARGLRYRGYQAFRDLMLEIGCTGTPDGAAWDDPDLDLDQLDDMMREL